LIKCSKTSDLPVACHSRFVLGSRPELRPQIISPINRERRARFGAKDRDHLPGNFAEELVIGLISVLGESTQFFESGLRYLDNDLEARVGLTRSGKVGSGVNVSGWHDEVSFQKRYSAIHRSPSKTPATIFLVQQVPEPTIHRVLRLAAHLGN
jgi:hypothetical protein